MPSVSLSPILNAQVVKTSGDPAAGWKISSHVAGSTTPLPTYTDATGSVAHSNPMVLDASGFPTQGQIWLEDGKLYKFVLSDENNVPQRTFDDISGVNDPSQISAEQWQDFGTIATYISANSFSLVGDQVGEYHVGRRVQLKLGIGFVYGTITASSYAPLAQLTTVTVTLDSAAVLTTALSQSNLSLLRADHHALPKIDYELDSLLVGTVNATIINLSGALNEAPQVTLPSAPTVNIGPAASSSVLITGTSTITSFGTAAAGILRMVEFQSSLTLTYNATSMQLPAEADLIAQPGDVLFAYSKGGGNWKIVGYALSSGAAISSAGVSRVAVFASPGSSSFIVPAGVSRVKVTVTGGGQTGSASSSSASGGAAGATAIKWVAGLVQGQSITVTVGAGGANTGQSPGQDSSFGAVCVAEGGKTGGALATGGDLNLAGGLPTDVLVAGTALGGDSYWGSNAFGSGGRASVADGVGGFSQGKAGVVVVEY